MLAFRVVELLGKEECGEATDAELQILRFLIPVAKLYTAKRAVEVASEALESFGGAGYVEDTGIPRLLRDAQVLPIWEGTTNVLSLDTLRAMGRSNALSAWSNDVSSRLATVTEPVLETAAKRVSTSLALIEPYAARAAAGGEAFQQVGARAFSYAIARIEAATALIQHAGASKDPTAIIAAQRWCRRELAPLLEGDEHHRARSARLIASEQ